MSEPVTAPLKREDSPPIRRRVTRLVQPYLHVEGENVANFEGDAEAMLSDPELLEEKDRKFLGYALRKCILPDEEEGYAVVMTGRQWGAWVGIRRRFMEAKRQRLFDSLHKFDRKPKKADY